MRNVLSKTLRDQRRALVGWTIGLVAFAALTVAPFPTLSTMPGFADMLENMPAAMRALIGDADITTPAGYLNGRVFFLLAPLLFATYAIGLGARLIAQEEEEGTLELLLSTPVPRRAVVVHKAAGMGFTVLVLTAVLWLTLFVPGRFVGLHVSPLRLASACLGAGLLGFELGILALAISAFRGRRGFSAAAATAIALAAYLLHTMAPLASWLQAYRRLSPFYHAYGYDPLRNGPHRGYIGITVLLTAGLLALAIVAFERRDVGR